MVCFIVLPKLSWALRHPETFPVDVNTADYEMLLRIPGIGPKSAMLIVNGRKFRKLNFTHLKKMGVVLKRAKYFISDTSSGLSICIADVTPEYVRRQLTASNQENKYIPEQLTFDFGA